MQRTRVHQREVKSETTMITHADIRLIAGNLHCSGNWTLYGIEGIEQRFAKLDWPKQKSITIDGTGITAFDTSGALALIDLLNSIKRAGQESQLTGLREEDRAVIDLVIERLPRAQNQISTPPSSNIAKLGRRTWEHVIQGIDFIGFIGEVSTVFGRILRQPKRFRWNALWANVESAGVNALPIIALLSFLMGIVIAYQGGVQLKLYGANIFIVELVTLTILREIAPLVTAIIVAGRTGSAYAAQIGTMQVSEEIDALRTIGISPIELLVLPKLLALIIALPLLSMFADVLGVLGGMVMAYTLLDVSFAEFLNRIPQTISTTSFLLGICKAPLFAAVIALVGCFQGLQVRGGADSVGRQTTVSVVQAIFLVIIIDALVAILLGGIGL